MQSEEEMSREPFAKLVCESIISLPQDLKATLRVVEDPEIDDESRVALAGALLHVLSGGNTIPGMRGILAYVDDVLVLRLVLAQAATRSPDAMLPHREESPEFLGALDSQLEIARAYLKDLMVVLEQAAAGVSKLTHHGHTAGQCVHDPDAVNWLYDAVQEAIVEQLEFDEDEVARESRSVDHILPHLRTRLQAH